MDYPEFCDYFDELANDEANGWPQLKKLALGVYDVNMDDSICELDLAAFSKNNIKTKSELHQNIFLEDWRAFSDFIYNKIKQNKTPEQQMLDSLYAKVGIVQDGD